MQKVVVEIARLPHALDELPEYATEGSSGMDLHLAGSSVRIAPGERRLLPTGIRIAIPPGYEGQVRMRSGFSLRTGLMMPNSPGTVDSDYRGEVQVPVINVTLDTIEIARGERFAQVVFAPVVRAHLELVAELTTTDRGQGGFGSTGA